MSKTESVCMHVFLDVDGVMADFNKAAIKELGMHPRDYEKYHGQDLFWKKIYAVDNFFFELELMHDAYDLFNGVKQLGFNPTFLTGLPRSEGFAVPADKQKQMWIEKYFPGSSVICCKSKNKYLHMKHHGDVLIDDWVKYMKIWQNAGGKFILHKNANDSLIELKEYIKQKEIK